MFCAIGHLTESSFDTSVEEELRRSERKLKIAFAGRMYIP